jgi:HlyD family secretion protein
MEKPDMRRALITLIALAILVVAGLWAYQRFFAQAEDPAVAEREEAIVERGTLLAVVNATGMVLPERQTQLAFQGAGRVAEVLVAEGETVQAGQALARLETTNLVFAIRQAELALSTAQTQYARLQAPPSEYDIATAEAALESARTSYNKLLAGPSMEEIAVARTNLKQAQASLKQAQAAYDQVADRPEIAMLPQSLQLEQATIALEAAEANFALTTRKPTEAELAAARSAVVQAESSLARLKQGVSEEEILLAQLQVQQAQISLDQARYQLEGTELAAPHQGTITLVGIQEGELSGGQPAFVLTDLSRYHIEVDVDEIDIGRVAVGQQASILLDALPGERLVGQIDQIASSAEMDTGIVSYRATIGLLSTNGLLRPGMTANVDIVTESRENVLLVPNRFISIDRLTGRTFVDRLVSNGIQPLEIQVGLRDETYSEVLAGLQEGDTVVLVQESSQDQLRRVMEMGRP